MRTRVVCHSCSQPIEADGELAGQSILCPTCATRFTPEKSDAVSEFAAEMKQKSETAAHIRTMRSVEHKSAYILFRTAGLILMWGIGLVAAGLGIWLLSDNRIYQTVQLCCSVALVQIFLFAATRVLPDIADTLGTLLRESRNR